MTDMFELTSRKMFFDFHNAYKGGDVPPVSKDAWKDIYNNSGMSDQCFLINDLWTEYAHMSQSDVDFYKKARQATFNHLPSEDKVAFLREYQNAISLCTYTNDKDKAFNSKIRAESAKEFKEMLNTLSAEEKQFMIAHMEAKEAFYSKQFGKKYNIPEFKKIDLSSLNPEIFSDHHINFRGLLNDASYLSQNEMEFLIKGSGYFTEQILEKYINKAMAQAGAGGAEKMLSFLQSRADNALEASSHISIDMPEMLLDLAHTNPKIGSDLLAEGFRIGYRATPNSVEHNGSIFDRFANDPMLQEAQDKDKARIDFNRLSKGEPCALSEALLKYNEEHLDDILTMYQKQLSSKDKYYNIDSDTKVLLATIEKGDFLSDESRAKIATVLLENNNNNRDSLDICLDFANKAKNTGTIAFDRFEKAMQDCLTPMIKEADERQKERVKANRKLKNAQKQQEKYCQEAGLRNALEIIENLQTTYKEITDLDTKPSKAYLPKEKAEALISRALTGEKVSVDLIDEPQGVKGFFAGNKEKNRICKQNEALKRLEIMLINVAVSAQKNTLPKNDIKKIPEPDKRREKLTGFETKTALQLYSGHILEEDTLSDLKSQSTLQGRDNPNIYDTGISDGDDALAAAQRTVCFEAEMGSYGKDVLRLVTKMKKFQTHRKEIAKEKTKEAKEQLALQPKDNLTEKAQRLEGLEGKDRTPVAKNMMLKKARNNKTAQR